MIAGGAGIQEHKSPERASGWCRERPLTDNMTTMCPATRMALALALLLLPACTYFQGETRILVTSTPA